MMPALPDTNQTLVPRMPAYLLSPRMALYPRPPQELFSPAGSPNTYQMSNGIVLVRQMLNGVSVSPEQRIARPITITDPCQQRLPRKCQKPMIPIAPCSTPVTLVMQSSKSMTTGQPSTPVTAAGHHPLPVSALCNNPLPVTGTYSTPVTVAEQYSKSVAVGRQSSKPVELIEQSTKQGMAVGQFPNIAKLICSEKPVDLSLKPPRNRSSKVVEMQEPEKPSSNQLPTKPTIPKSSAAITSVSQSEPKMKKATYLLCRYCPFKAVTKEQIQSHILSSHPQRVVVVPKTFTCNYCTYVTSSELCMVRHLLSSHRSMILPSRAGAENLFSCSVCVFSADEPTMIHHMLDHYKDSKPCNYCTSCAGSSYLPSGRKRKTGTSTIKSRPKSVKKKLADLKPKSSPNITSSTENLECKLCHVKFSSKVQLQAHEPSHSSRVPQLNNVSKSVEQSKSSTSPKPTTSQTSSIKEMAAGTDECNNQLSITPTTSTSLTAASKEENPKQPSTKSKHSDSQSNTVRDNMTSSISHTDTITVNSIALSTTSVSVASSLSQDSTTVSTAMPVADLTPAKRRKLAMKIFKNSSGVYESERSDTPKSISNVMCPDEASMDSLKLRVQVPLNVLSSQEFLPTTITDDHERDPHLPTTIVNDPEAKIQKAMHLQIPLHLLPKQRLAVKQVNAPSNSTELTKIVETPATDGIIKTKISEFQAITCSTNVTLSCTTPMANGNQTSLCSSASVLAKAEQHGSKLEADPRKVLQDTENVNSDGNLQDYIVGEAFNEIKPGKLMANMLKKKLSNIYLKSKQTDLPCDVPDPSKTAESLSNLMNHVGQCQYVSKKTVTRNNTDSETQPVISSLKDGDFIDLTLEDSSDEESQPASHEQRSRIECQPKGSHCSADSQNNSKRKASPAKSIPSKVTKVADTQVSNDTDRKHIENHKTSGQSQQLMEIKNPEVNKSENERQISVDPENVSNTSERVAKSVATNEIPSASLNDSSQENRSKINGEKSVQEILLEENTASECRLPTSMPSEKPLSSTSNIMVANKDVNKPEDTANAVTTASQVVDQVPTPLPQLPRRPKKMRRSALRLPSMSGTTTLNTLDSEDLVVCPYCPKRLLFRLLPAHAQFHGSDCEHKCRDCNFATSFKWVLDTHVQCHKEVFHTNARQITEVEWMNMKDGSFYEDDEEVEMTQRLLIREEPASMICKKQIARKTIAKKSISLPANSTRKSISGANSAATVDIPTPLPVNKTKARCMEDFFAQILTDRVKPK